MLNALGFSLHNKMRVMSYLAMFYEELGVQLRVFSSSIIRWFCYKLRKSCDTIYLGNIETLFFIRACAGFSTK